MNRLLALLLAVGILTGCGSGNKHAPGERPLTFSDFKALFPEQKVPYRLMADSLLKKMPDSLALQLSELKMFLTDTLTGTDTTRAKRLKYFPLAYIAGPEVQYFIVKAADKSSATAYLCITDKKGKYLSSLAVASKKEGSNTEQMSGMVDSKYLIKTSTERQVGSNTALREDFYMAGADGKLTLIMTNSNGPTAGGQIFNPIDTLPRKHKFSGDYTSGDMSLVAIRDGQDAKSFQFFISFVKDNGGCRGELNGVGHFTGSNKGEYKDKESSCGIAFQFSGSRVSIREVGGCGAYRGIKCFFEGGFTKKKKSDK
jgi:hypothetical protein